MRTDTKIWSAATAGPAAWLVLLLVSWVLTPGAHEAGRVPVLRALHVLALVITAIAALIAWREHRRLQGIDSDDDIIQRQRFLARFALILGAASILLVIGSAIPTFMLLPGSEP